MRRLLQFLLVLIPVAGLKADIINGTFNSPGLPPGQEEQGLPVNSSFITGWTTVPGYNGAVDGTVEYLDQWSQDPGGYSAELGAYFTFIGIQQTFATLPNQSYLATLWLATDPFNGPPAEIRASAGNTVASFAAAPGTGNEQDLDWQQVSFLFTSDGSGLTTLQLQNTVGVAAIDTISVTAVPEPTGLVLIGVCVSLIWGGSRQIPIADDRRLDKDQARAQARQVAAKHFGTQLICELW
jgi:hypothetical protein